VAGTRIHIRGIFAGCCAAATTPTVRYATMTRIDMRKTFLNSHLVREGII
jgi:hypothetical protein